MELIKYFIDFVLHLDTHLIDLVARYGAWTNAILFLIIFCETGLVVTPFLPGDSLIFAVGALSAKGVLNFTVVTLLMIVAAILGDTVNYWVGYRLGPKVFASDSSRWLNRQHLERTHQFYAKYGGKTIIIARFMPIIRTFAPFVAGIGRMSYRQFFLYNVVGAILWIILFMAAGYLFGNIPVVRRNFTLVIFAIIILSVMPGMIEYLRARRQE
ncbi:MAG: DedA family protein [Acidobacteria bacterium]|nr:DedA family protein [Acidobacteriota bacterium]